MMTDPIADLFTRIRNSVSAKQEKIEVPSSILKTSVVELLKEEGFIKNFRVIKDTRQGILRIYLKYVNEESVIRGVKRVSKPGRRVYVKHDKLPKVLNGLGVAIISTSTGVCSDQTCREKGIGGEVLGYIW